MAQDQRYRDDDRMSRGDYGDEWRREQSRYRGEQEYGRGREHQRGSEYGDQSGRYEGGRYENQRMSSQYGAGSSGGTYGQGAGRGEWQRGGGDYGSSSGGYGYGSQGEGYSGSRYRGGSMSGGYTGGYDEGWNTGYGTSGYGMSDWRNRDYGRGSSRQGGERAFWDRATDEVQSWFGDDDAQRRRRMDQYRGKGPKNYTRSDDRIREDVSERLTDNGEVDASEIEITVKNGEVTLSGTVHDRYQRRKAEDLAEQVSGVRHVQNNVRVQDQSGTWQDSSTTGTSRTGGTATTQTRTGATTS